MYARATRWHPHGAPHRHREQYPAVLETHRTLLRAAFTAYEGWEVDTQGDSFFVVFLRATQAVAAAVQIQRALAPASWPQGGAVRVRIGLHTCVLDTFFCLGWFGPYRRLWPHNAIHF